MKRLLPASLLVLALALPACGGDDATPRSAQDATAGTSKGSTSLKVAATDARTGDATTASSEGGVERLEGERKVDAKVRRKVERKEGVGAGAACADVDVMPDGSNLGVVQAATLCLLNGERADRGLAPLALNDKLAAAALKHTQDMVANQYFAHDGRDGSDVVDRVKATGYIPSSGRWTVGENLAWGTGTLATPRGIVNAWMNSTGHRDNILRGDYKEIGFGIVIGNPRSTDGEGATYTTNFGAVSGTTVGAPATQSTTTTTSQRPATKKLSCKTRKAKRTRACRARAAKARAARRAAASRR
jgi:uncharacterized protein YkwD